MSKEILTSGTNFLNDVENNINPRTAFNKRTEETIANLKRKAMFGEGFKARVSRKRSHSRKGSRAVKTKLAKKLKKKTSKKRDLSKKKRRDIFHK